MANEKIQNLLQASTKGDHEAIRGLMNLGESYLKEGDLVNAAQAFKEAAISYRIDAFRQGSKYSDERETSQWQLEIINQVFLRWLAANAGKIPTKRPELLEIPEARLTTMFRSGELHDISTIMQFLEQTLESMGVEFYSPGGSSLRVILRLLRAFGGEKDVWAQPILDDVRIRVALDQLVDRIVRASAQKTTQ